MLRNKYGISEEDTNELLALFQEISVADNIIPKTLSELEQLTRDLVVHHQVHSICQCEQFRFTKEDKCPVCQKGKKDSLRYYTIPIGPRIQQFMEVSALAKLMTTMQRSTGHHHRFVQDLHMSPAWSTFKSNMGDNAVALSYCSDGFQPFHHIMIQGSYSIWAQTGLILNLPSDLRTKIGTTLLYGLIPGPRAPKAINVYNEVVVNELVQLSGNGLPVFNAETASRDVIKVGVLYMVGDVPGIAKEQNRVQQNAKTSCGHCTLEGQHSAVLDKTVYPGSRKFLQPDDPLRTDEHGTITKLTCREEVAIAKYQDSLQREMNDTGRMNSTLMTAVAQQTGRYGNNHWFRLNLDLQQKHAPVEPMHAIKKRNIGQRRADAAKGETEPLQKKFPKGSLPPAPFILKPEEKATADKRLGLVKVPIGFGNIPATLFTRICGGVKSHTWLQLYTKGLLRFCLRGFLGDQQRASLFKTLRLLEQLFSSVMDTECQDELEDQWHQALACLERDFPASLQTFVFHLLHHLPTYIRQYGPPANFWMFPYERFNHTLSTAITNSQHPEISAIKKIEIQWLVTMLDNAGFMEPLRQGSSTAPDYQYLSKGRFAAVERPATDEEDKLIKQFLGPCNLTAVRVLHYATVGGNRYRDTTIEDSTMRESASVVFLDERVCRIKNFVSVDVDGVRYELVFLECYGIPHHCSDSLCKYITVNNPIMCVSNVTGISAPLVHALDNDILWLL